MHLYMGIYGLQEWLARDTKGLLIVSSDEDFRQLCEVCNYVQVLGFSTAHGVEVSQL